MGRPVTAVDLSAIRAQLAGITKLGEWETRGNAVVIYDPNGYGAYCPIATTDTKEDAAFIAAAPSTVARLLAVVERVEKIAASMDRIADFNLSVVPHDDMGISLKQHAQDLRAAITGDVGA